MNIIFRLVSIVVLLTIFNQVTYAQGWVREWGIANGSQLKDVEEAMNGDLIMGGYYNAFWTPNTPAYFVRMTPDGDTVWTTFAGDFYCNEIELVQNDTIVGVGEELNEPVFVKLDAFGNLINKRTYSNINGTMSGQFLSLKKLPNGDFITLAEFDGRTVYVNNKPYDICTVSFVRLNANGDVLWVQNRVDSFTADYPWAWPRGHKEITPTSDGGFIVAGTKFSEVNSIARKSAYLIKLNATGGVMWEQALNLAMPESQAFSIKETVDGGYIISGRENDDAVLVKTNANGIIQWRYTLFVGQTSAGSNNNHYWNPKDVIEDSDGNYVVTGNHGGAEGNLSLYKVSSQGVLLWMEEVSSPSPYLPMVNYLGNKITETSDGGYAVVGTASDYGITKWMFACKVDSLGRAVTASIEGNVYADLNSNCAWDALEYPLVQWVVIADGNNGQTYYGITDTSGYYSIPAEFGSYNVNLSLPNPYWDTICIGTGVANLNTPHEVDTVDFPVEAAISCPLLHVDISTGILERCFTSTYYVEYCNWGMVDEMNAYVEVQLDSFLTYDTSSVAGVHLGSNLYRFAIGTVERGTCGNFWINVDVTCDASLFGMTHCTEAHIYPDSLCLPSWTGPNITVDPMCLGDTVLFRIMNTGGNMASSLNYNIFEDNVMMLIGGYNLGSGQIENVFVPTQNGSTYRIEARQVPNFPPLLGDTIVSVAIEGCRLDSNGTINTGFVTQFSNYDGNPFVDVDCQPNVGSYDPNDKLAYPVGYGAEHYIYNHTDLEYYIRFQNTGTAPARKVVIIDTLSQYLDVASLRVGASSHNYTYEIYGNGIIKFTFDNIQLPDSATDYNASQGFVKYRIEQRANNPIGTIINNHADIYFDFNAPIRTNTTFHEIGTDFVTIQLVGIENVMQENVLVNVYPNPFHEIATVEIEGEEFSKVEFELYDLTGRVVYQKTSSENSFDINKTDLVQGVYIYRIVADGKLLNTGKLIAR